MDFQCQNCGVRLQRSKKYESQSITCLSCSHKNVPPHREFSEPVPALERLLAGSEVNGHGATIQVLFSPSGLDTSLEKCQECRSASGVDQYVYLETHSISVPAPGIPPLYHPRCSGSTSYYPKQGRMCAKCAKQIQQKSIGEQALLGLFLIPLGAVIGGFAGWKLLQHHSSLWFFALLPGACLLLAGFHAILQAILFARSRPYAVSCRLAQIASRGQGLAIRDSFGVTTARGAVGTLRQEQYRQQLKDKPFH